MFYVHGSVHHESIFVCVQRDAAVSLCSFKYSWWWVQRTPETCREILQRNKIETANCCISLDTHTKINLMFYFFNDGFSNAQDDLTSNVKVILGNKYWRMNTIVNCEICTTVGPDIWKILRKILQKYIIQMSIEVRRVNNGPKTTCNYFSFVPLNCVNERKKGR
jgi:hypothetical protein